MLTTELSEYDVFVSYSNYDKDWVENWLLPKFKKADVRFFVGSQDFELGAPRVTEIERAIRASRRTLLIITPEYLNSTWTQYESLIVQTRDLAASQRKILPIILKSCALPVGIDSLVSLDFTRPDEQIHAYNRLIQELTQSHKIHDTPEISSDTSRLDGVNPTSVHEGNRVSVEFVIERDFDSYTLKEQEQLLNVIRESLKLNGSEVKVTRKESGSVRLTIEIPEDKAEELLELAQSGKFDAFGVVDAQLVANLPNTVAPNQRQGSLENYQILDALQPYNELNRKKLQNKLEEFNPTTEIPPSNIEQPKLTDTIELEKLIVELQEMSPFSEILRLYIKRQNIKNNELAEKLHIAPSTMSSWTRGNRHPDISHLHLIGDALELNDNERSALLHSWIVTTILDSASVYLSHASIHHTSSAIEHVLSLLSATIPKP